MPLETQVYYNLLFSCLTHVTINHYILTTLVFFTYVLCNQYFMLSDNIALENYR